MSQQGLAPQPSTLRGPKELQLSRDWGHISAINQSSTKLYTQRNPCRMAHNMPSDSGSTSARQHARQDAASEEKRLKQKFLGARSRAAFNFRAIQFDQTRSQPAEVQPGEPARSPRGSLRASLWTLDVVDVGKRHAEGLLTSQKMHAQICGSRKQRLLQRLSQELRNPNDADNSRPTPLLLMTSFALGENLLDVLLDPLPACLDPCADTDYPARCEAPPHRWKLENAMPHGDLQSFLHKQDQLLDELQKMRGMLARRDAEFEAFREDVKHLLRSGGASPHWQTMHQDVVGIEMVGQVFASLPGNTGQLVNSHRRYPISARYAGRPHTAWDEWFRKADYDQPNPGDGVKIWLRGPKWELGQPEQRDRRSLRLLKREGHRALLTLSSDQCGKYLSAFEKSERQKLGNQFRKEGGDLHRAMSPQGQQDASFLWMESCGDYAFQATRRKAKASPSEKPWRLACVFALLLPLCVVCLRGAQACSFCESSSDLLASLWHLAEGGDAFRLLSGPPHRNITSHITVLMCRL
ncbi:UVH6 [Symbiodinium sp. CCMP2592]|nr:UVH6 [Symbiodinium sp. CCMP2592]